MVRTKTTPDEHRCRPRPSPGRGRASASRQFADRATAGSSQAGASASATRPDGHARPPDDDAAQGPRRSLRETARNQIANVSFRDAAGKPVTLMSEGAYPAGGALLIGPDN